MRYERPTMRTSREIMDILADTTQTPSDRTNAVLSALYYGESVAFSGDVLIKEFSEAKYDKMYLLNLFGTFYQMRATTYRIDESISLLNDYMRECPKMSTEIQGIIDELIEGKTIFG